MCLFCSWEHKSILIYRLLESGMQLRNEKFLQALLRCLTTSYSSWYCRITVTRPHPLFPSFHQHPASLCSSLLIPLLLPGSFNFCPPPTASDSTSPRDELLFCIFLPNYCPYNNTSLFSFAFQKSFSEWEKNGVAWLCFTKEYVLICYNCAIVKKGSELL